MFETALNTPLVVVKNYTNISKISGRIQQFLGGCCAAGESGGRGGGSLLALPWGEGPINFGYFIF